MSINWNTARQAFDRYREEQLRWNRDMLDMIRAMGCDWNIDLRVDFDRVTRTDLTVTCEPDAGRIHKQGIIEAEYFSYIDASKAGQALLVGYKYELNLKNLGVKIPNAMIRSVSCMNRSREYRAPFMVAITYEL